MKRVYAILVAGGEPFELKVKGNFPLEHDGRTSLFHPVLSSTEIEPLLELIRECGGHVECNLTEESEEQREIRNRMLGDVELPCTRCADCRFFNPTWERLCEKGAVPETLEDCSKFVAEVVTDLG